MRGKKTKRKEKKLQFLVSRPKHLAESSYFSGATLLVRRLLEIPLGPSITYDTLAIQTLLEAPNGTVHGFTLTNLYFNRHIAFGNERKKNKIDLAGKTVKCEEATFRSY